MFDLVHDWLVDLSVNEGLSMHVIPLPREPATMTHTWPLPHGPQCFLYSRKCSGKNGKAPSSWAAVTTRAAW